MNHYEVLKVADTATADEVRAAYLRLVQQYHPDRHVGQSISDADREYFKQIQDAYDTLYDEKRRAEYDRVRSIPQPRGGPVQPRRHAVVTPVNPNLRRDVPNDWVQRHPARRKRKRTLRNVLYLAVVVLIAGAIVPQCSQLYEAASSFESEEIPIKSEAEFPAHKTREYAQIVTGIIELPEVAESEAVSSEEAIEEPPKRPIRASDVDQLIQQTAYFEESKPNLELSLDVPQPIPFEVPAIDTAKNFMGQPRNVPTFGAPTGVPGGASHDASHGDISSMPPLRPLGSSIQETRPFAQGDVPGRVSPRPNDTVLNMGLRELPAGPQPFTPLPGSASTRSGMDAMRTTPGTWFESDTRADIDASWTGSAGFEPKPWKRPEPRYSSDSEDDGRFAPFGKDRLNRKFNSPRRDLRERLR